jgi:hypothetical protein
MKVSNQLHYLMVLSPGICSYQPFDRRLGVPQSRSERCEVEKNFFHLQGIELQPSRLYLVVIPTELSRILHFVYRSVLKSLALNLVLHSSVVMAERLLEHTLILPFKLIGAVSNAQVF